MGTTQVSASWTGEKLNFLGTDTKGNNVPMGGANTSPSQLMLLGLAGCTGMDVVSILQKKRQNITGVQVQVIGHNPDEYPKPYQQVELKFTVTGDNVDPKAVERAIHLSETKYCVVGQTLQNKVEISTSFEIKSE
ncbi:MAG: OsmC family peroxiredoxin [Chloroflexi bacterium]|nr:MAG: OsmC family peroxiredoxin [Chloroflexota bacterium]